MACAKDEERTVLEATTVFLLMKKGFPISRNVRAQWMFEHLDTLITIQCQSSKQKEAEELEIVSVLPKNKPHSWSADTSHQFLYKVTSTTSIIFLAHKYRIVLNLDLSPSLATVDIQHGEIVIDEVCVATKHFLEGEDKYASGASDLAKAVQNRLFPGVTSGQAAADRLEAISTLKAITLCITTRAIGFGTVHTFIALFDLNNVPIRGDIYQLYRVSLAMMEAKIQICQESTNMIVDNLDDLQVLNNSADFLRTCRSRTVLPDPVSRPINAIGNVKTYDAMYYPRIAANRYDNQERFIPQSEHVLFSNLRETVVALSDNSPGRLEHRRRFHENNPIPGCIWDNNHVLQNPDDIMPADYDIGDLNDDMDDVQSKITFLARKSPKYFTEAISYGSEGSKSILSSNFQSGMRVRDRNRGEPLADYYRRVRVDGDISTYENLQRLTGAEQISATLCLLGERPLTASAMYPSYVTRDSRCCVESSPMSYKAARSITYNNA